MKPVRPSRAALKRIRAKLAVVMEAQQALGAIRFRHMQEESIAQMGVTKAAEDCKQTIMLSGKARGIAFEGKTAWTFDEATMLFRPLKRRKK